MQNSEGTAQLLPDSAGSHSTLDFLRTEGHTAHAQMPEAITLSRALPAEEKIKILSGKDFQARGVYIRGNLNVH